MNLRELVDERYLPHARRTLKPRTVAEYERLFLRTILPALGDRALGRLTLDAIEKWHAGMDAPIEANRALAALSAALTYAVDRRLLAANPARGVHRNRESAKERFLTPDECARLLAAARAWKDPRARFVELLLLTGARPGELADAVAAWRDGAALRIPDGKTGARTIFLSAAACAVLSALPARADGRLFPPDMDVRRAWERLASDAELTGVRLYDLRHTFASSALAAGVPLDVIGRLLGHRKLQTTLRYSHLAADTALEGVARAAERMGA